MSREGLGVAWFSRAEATLTRSSHFPLTVSKLFPTRCDGDHFLVGGAPEPLGFVFENEFVRVVRGVEDPFPPREDVRSSRRV
jgi:hypothetical protein